MVTKIRSANIRGIDALCVSVETDVSRGMPVFSIVGSADSAVRESRERIRAAILNSGMDYPMGRVTVNIAPADIRKRGSLLDLPIALGMLASCGQIKTEELDDYAVIGELSLDGKVTGVKGVLPMMQCLAANGIKKVVLPEQNIREASLIKGVELYAAADLESVCRHFRGEQKIPVTDSFLIPDPGKEEYPDFSDVAGQEEVKRALTIAAAGGHGILMRGSPSTGKTMMAERVPGILPPMTYEEIMETTGIYSAAGLLSPEKPYVNTRPFRRPHHKTTACAMIGGGSHPIPGEVTLSHKGVLFLDEFAEFERGVIDSLRQPMEDKQVTISRLGESFTYPTDFLLVAAANPCYCGYYGDPYRECRCTFTEVERYQRKISGPVKDRIDIHMDLIPVKYGELSGGARISTEQIREKVMDARNRQCIRFKDTDIELNSQMTYKMLDRYAGIDEDTRRMLKEAYTTMKMNPRTLMKVRKIARTIADLERKEKVEKEHIREALQYREREI